METCPLPLVEETPAVLKGSDYAKLHRIHYIDSRAALLNSIKLCGKQKNLCEAIKIHTNIRECGLIQKDVNVGTALISMYAKCGSLSLAKEVFEELPAQDTVSWTALIAGYAQNGLGNEALECFGQMREKGLLPNAITFTCLLKACSILRLIQTGEEIHSEVLKQGLLEKDFALMDMYAKCGMLNKAQEVFEELPVRNVVTWTAMIAGYTQHGLNDEALSCFRQMRDEGISPNVVTFTCILKVCSTIRSLDIGQMIHEEVRKQMLLENDIMVGIALVDMYAKCGDIGKAQEVFEKLPVQDVVSWNALISGYVKEKLLNEALECFWKMKKLGVYPDAVTYTCILKICNMC